eukprot:g2997.t1
MATTTAWSSGLFSCFEDCCICCEGTFCFPCLYGLNVHRVQGTDTLASCCMYMFCGCCVCWIGRAFRFELREKYNLPEEPCSDCLVHLCCPCLAICQEAREIEKRT